MTNDVNDDFLTHSCPSDVSINPPNIRSIDKVQSCVPEIILSETPEKSTMFIFFCGNSQIDDEKKIQAGLSRPVCRLPYLV
jgi:hypothetical protein